MNALFGMSFGSIESSSQTNDGASMVAPVPVFSQTSTSVLQV